MDERSNDVEKVTDKNIKDAEKAEESTEVVDTKNDDEFKDAVSAVENVNVDIMEDANSWSL